MLGSRNVVVVAIAALVVLSGCTTASAATARQGQGEAGKEAREWENGATLMVIIGLEGTGWNDAAYTPWGDQDAPEEGQKMAKYFERAAEDAEVGDGRAEVWAYGYLSDAKPNEVLVVFVDKDGDVMGRETFSVPTDEMADIRPIGSYNIDSDEALEKAKEASQGLRDGLAKSNYTVFVALAHPEEVANPVWMVGGFGGDMTGFGGGIVMVDAMTGTATTLGGEGGWGSGDWT